jgi:peptidyl-Asp metalloendopeptidase
MRRLALLFVPLLLTALFGAACSRTTSQAKAADGTDVTGAAAGKAAPVVPSRRAAAFASLPDRGNLIGYPAQRVERQEHASTWHRADVSEEHALRAVVTGEMTVTAPDGQPIRLRYQRHLEHPNGNWTWIGRDEYGEEAIVTFGEKAVFGSIPRHDDEELRLATSDGRSWVVEPDSRKQHHPDMKRPDYIVPPEMIQPLISGEPVTASASTEALAPAAVATTVDVALGYTNGFASELGGDSQAVTRLQNLVDVTNQAFSNSQISAQVRLVRTVRVNYADATDNNDALAKLSGYESGTGNIPVDPAFNALRAARDQYGADLVSLVRRYRAPENEGCGVAWLIGGDQTRIDSSDAPWGYSVVSDDLDSGDLDETDNKTYICRKETLAHELGHNMGQAHNSEDSDGTAGAHSYSYGYRETSITGFYTVMAYRLADSSQKPIRYFANPNVMDAATGRPTGIANASDNARSLSLVMPIIAGFRAAAVPGVAPVRDDFNGDRISDIFWRSTAGGNVIWRSANASTRQYVSSVGTHWSLAGVGDFEGDGRSDVLWRNTAGNNTIWRSANGATPQYISSVGTHWSVAGIGDFNGDGRSDILWRNTAGNNAIWRSANAASQQSVSSVGTQWSVAGIGDFNGDRRSDILWRNTAGNNVIWFSGNAGTSQYISSVGVHWFVAGVGDFNADGRSDVLWRSTSGGNVIWRSANASTQQYVSSVSTSWSVAATGDFNGDSYSDVLWRNGSANVIWRSANASTQQTTGPFGSEWTAMTGKPH